MHACKRHQNNLKNILEDYTLIQLGFESVFEDYVVKKTVKKKKIMKNKIESDIIEASSMH